MSSDCTASLQEDIKHSSGPLFLFVDGKPVTYAYVSAQLAKSIADLGLNSSLYKGHSSRIGAATHAAK